MGEDFTPKQKLQTNLYALNEKQNEFINNVYVEIGKIACKSTCDSDISKVAISEKKALIKYFEGVQNGLSQASNAVREMIPEMDEICEIALQLRNWIRSSGNTQGERLDCLKKANELLKLLTIEDEN